jgi:thymidylate synthase (FAD)
MNHNPHRRQVLDHGFVVLRNLAGPTRRTHDSHPMGLDYKLRPFDADDIDVPNAARKSFDGNDRDRSYEVEMKLARYLAENEHMTPFEFIQVWLEIKMPIFVARQLVRHRTQSIDEWSARYIPLPEEWYIPELENVVIQSRDKKQGGRPVDLENVEEKMAALRYTEALDASCRQSYAYYQAAISDGIAMEQARLHLHVNHYTAWISSMNLRNLFHLLSLRDHSHAQWENGSTPS